LRGKRKKKRRGKEAVMFPFTLREKREGKKEDRGKSERVV